MIGENKALRKEVLRFCTDFGYDYVEEEEDCIILEDTNGFHQDMQVDSRVLIQVPINEVYNFLAKEQVRSIH